jgi:hypothetical protein
MKWYFSWPIVLLAASGPLSGCAQPAFSQPVFSDSAVRNAEAAAAMWYRAFVLDKQLPPALDVVVDPRVRYEQAWGPPAAAEHIARVATALTAGSVRVTPPCPENDAQPCRLRPGVYRIALGPTVAIGDTLLVYLVTWRGQSEDQQRHAAGVSTYHLRMREVDGVWTMVKSSRIVGQIDFTVDPWGKAGVSPPPE